MDFSNSWNFSNRKTWARSRMNDKENDVLNHKNPSRNKKATLV